MAARHVVIIGGGLAGLASAVALGPHGYRVTLLESRPRLGGRASSFQDQQSGTWIDNCQHVSMGCCTNFQHFCRTAEIDRFLRTEKTLYFIGRDNRVNRFQENLGPAPLHLALSFARLSYLSLSDKIALGRGLRKLCGWRPDPKDRRTFAQWLAAANQPQTVIDRFWQVVLTSALSESLERIEIGQARKVFVDGFLANRDGWKVQVPTIPLGELYGQHLRSWLERHGVEIRLQAGVAKILEENQTVTGVELRNGERISADEVILATPQNLAASFLSPGSLARPLCDRGSRLETAPISSVHLWFDRPILSLPHAVLVDRLSQWIFARDLPENTTGYYYQVVISDSRVLRGNDQEATIAQVVEELAEIWPVVRESKLLHSRLVTEHNAVFSVTPESEALRPGQETPVKNLFLAGDWTQTGWPATMEGAVRSGYLAAEVLLRKHGDMTRILQPDLPVAPGARWLLGLKPSTRLV